jgi:hypothetical protein
MMDRIRQLQEVALARIAAINANPYLTREETLGSV